MAAVVLVLVYSTILSSKSILCRVKQKEEERKRRRKSGKGKGGGGGIVV